MSSHGNNNNNNNNNNESPSIRDRRGSLNPGSSLSDFLSSNRQPQPPSAYPGPITTAAAHANTQRRMSMSSANGSPPQGPGTFTFRRGSVSSISSVSSVQDESAIDDSESASGSPSSPFVRRMSWGARALRDVRLPGSARVPPSPSTSSPTISRGMSPLSSLRSPLTSDPPPPHQDSGLTTRLADTQPIRPSSRGGRACQDLQRTLCPRPR